MTHNETRLKIKYEPFGCNFPKSAKIHRRDGSCGTGGKKIYENKVIPFENTDDSYKSKMSAYYSEWSSIGDKFSDAGNAIRDFLAGIGDSLVDTVKGLLTLVVDLGLLYVHSECSRMTLGHVPETLDQEVEKIKQKYEPLLKDPVNTIGGIGQSICDTADEKGVAYSSGYIVTEVVTALLADKGLDKLKNVAKTGKTADNVADIAEGAAKGAGNAAEDAGKAGKGLEEAAKGAESAAEDAGKVVESGSNFKGQLYNGTRNPDVDFVNGKGKSTLNKHAGKHGYTSPEEYLKDARNFLEKKPTSTIQSFVSNEGTYFRYDTATNEFGIINEYGGISTYFKPENGMAYWLEQIEKYAPK